LSNNIRKFIRNAGYTNGYNSVVTGMQKRAWLEDALKIGGGAALGAGGTLLAQQLMGGGGRATPFKDDEIAMEEPEYGPEQYVDLTPEEARQFMALYDQQNPYGFYYA
jgi:hypothetical protein